jgi:hypothetical protein
MRPAVVAVLLLVAACTPTKTPPLEAAPSATAVTVAPAPSPSASSVAVVAPVAPSDWPAALPVPALPPPAPLAADGYPAAIRTCLPDPAFLAGFTRDGEDLGYCMHGMGIRCELVDRAGHRRAEAAGGLQPDDAAVARAQKKEADIERAMRATGLPELKNANCELHPPPLRGTFRFGDIKLSVMPIAGTFEKDVPKSEPTVKVGGSVAGEKPVYPFVYGRPNRKAGEAPRYSNGTELNVLALSPDEKELGIVTHSNCMEWCDEFEIVRMPVERFAASVYNDTGFRAYKAGRLDRAKELFARAAYVDPGHELAAYNLACVYAKQGDAAHAEPALALAIRRGGDAVKKRARGDADFAPVKSAPWFETLTGS